MVTIPSLHLLPALASAIALYFLYWIYWELTVGASRRRMIREHGCEKPVQLPDWDPIFGLGNTFTIMRWAKERRLLQNGLARFNALGSTSFATNSLGHRFIMTIEPEILKNVLALQFKSFAFPTRRKKAFQTLLGNGIFNSDGAAWQHSREMLRPNFVRSQVGDLDTYEKHVDNLLAVIPRDGSTVDLQPLFHCLTMDSATEMLYGESTSTLVPSRMAPGAAEFADAFQQSQRGALDRTRFGLLYQFLPDAEYREQVRTVHSFLDTFVDRAFARQVARKAGNSDSSSTRYIFADELVTRTTDREQVRGELLNILLAGRDTTASLLSNVWFELAKRPDIYAKVKAEINDLLPRGRGGLRPTYEQIKSAKYLRAVLNESLRLYPLVPGNAREALVDTVLPLGGGPEGKAPMFVPKGTAVGWSLFTMHRRKDFYGEDSEDFRPERWLGEKGLRPTWEYLPFNAGPRICLGRACSLSRG